MDAQQTWDDEMIIRETVAIIKGWVYWKLTVDGSAPIKIL